MQLKSRIIQMFAFLLFTAAGNAYADSWNCSRDDLVREVIIEYPQGGSIPCDVVYKKQTEGFEDQVLWSAENLEGYCEEKAGDLVAKLESWGWVCLETVSPETGADAGTEAGTEAAAEAGAETAAEPEASAATQ